MLKLYQTTKPLSIWNLRTNMKKVYFKVFINPICYQNQNNNFDLDYFLEKCKYLGIKIEESKSNDTVEITLNNGKLAIVLPEKKIIFANNTDGIFKQAKLSPKIFTSQINEQKVSQKLASIEESRLSILNRLEKDFNDKISKNLTGYSGSNQIFEDYSGACFLYNFEWELHKENPLRILFSKKNEIGYLYSLPLDDIILLRGAYIYYYYSAFVQKEVSPTKQNISEWFDNTAQFLADANNAIRDYTVDNKVSIKLLIALIDNLRNIILTIINAYYLRGLFISTNDSDGTILMKVVDIGFGYQLFSKYMLAFEDLLFNDDLTHINQITINQIKELIKETDFYLQNFREYVLEIDNDFYYQKCFDPLREMDNFCENYKLSKEMAEKLSDKGDKINLYALLCGATEISFMIKYFSKNKECNLIMSIQNYGMYMVRNQKDPNYSYTDLNYDFDSSSLKDGKNYLIDENVMTAKTAQLFINDQLINNVLFDGCIFFKYPCLGRTSQLVHYDACVNLDLVDKYILGFFVPSPYTNINCIKNRTGSFSFVDEFGFFTKSTEVFLKGLYKNAAFLNESETGIFNNKKFL